MFCVIYTLNCRLHYHCCVIETKTKEDILVNQNARTSVNSVNQSNYKANSCSGLEARENVCKHVTIGLVLQL